MPRAAGPHGAPDHLASNVMLLDCAKPPHRRFEAQPEDLSAGRLDHVDWMRSVATPPFRPRERFPVAAASDRG